MPNANNYFFFFTKLKVEFLTNHFSYPFFFFFKGGGSEASLEDLVKLKSK